MKSRYLLRGGAAVLALACSFWGCSKANDNAPLFDPTTGKHPGNWVEIHGQQYISNPQQCVECHGSTTNPSGSGGTSKVSCFSTSIGAQLCHAGGPSPANHQQPDWQGFAKHGLAGAMAAPGATTGFATCQVCHGQSYAGTQFIPSCVFNCHGNTGAPHPPKPWHGTTASGTNHTLTDPGNAAACAQCHRNGQNLTTIPAPNPPASASTPAGCFNGTLCHTSAVIHPAGWSNVTSSVFHGPRAKGASGTSAPTGFTYCQICHGTNFGGTAASGNVSCFAAQVTSPGGTVSTCHNNGQPATTPHSPRPWTDILGSVRTHSSTDPSNAAVCIACHQGGANAPDIAPPPAPPAGTPPGCFNNTLCHGTNVQPPHPINGSFLPGSAHGSGTLVVNGATVAGARQNIAACQICHATPSTGVNPRFTLARGVNMPNGCETCHTPQTAHPTPWVPGRGTTNGAANATSHAGAGNMSGACTLCHGTNLDGAGGVAPSCMSSSLRGVTCHTSKPIDANGNDVGCISCHGAPPNGTAFPNVQFNHDEHIFPNVDCSACHSGAGFGSNVHANGTPVMSISATYQAKTGGTAAFNAATITCSNVSCHGGIITPPWPTGLINTSTDCTSCHTAGTAFQTPQFNSYFSGQHGFHVVSVGLACTQCHDTAKLAGPAPPSHFSGLNTPAFDLAPALTIRDVVHYTGTGGTCTPDTTPGNFSINVCHGTRSWQ
jgi:predicted CxxxxCH...CXXCH cytochrome family protein